jgi:hypothetical protein
VINLEDTSMTKTLKISAYRIPAASIGVGLAVLFWAKPAPAAPFGDISTCFVVNPNRFQCDFPTLTTAVNIQYVSMQCGSTGTTPFSLQQFQFLALPPNGSVEIGYQIPIANQASLAGNVNAGSPVSLFPRAGFAPRALIDLSPAPSGTTQCTVSISGR